MPERNHHDKTEDHICGECPRHFPASVVIPRSVLIHSMAARVPVFERCGVVEAVDQMNKLVDEFLLGSELS